MILTDKQEEGLKIILSRYNAGEKYTTISGYAGTGKSTLVRFAIEALDIPKPKIAYATFTGKAAEVLRKKGNEGACTLHRLLYEHIPLPNGKFLRKKIRELGLKVVVVDEVSMVPRSMIELLLSHNVYVIFLGDPFQLPQIDKQEANDILDHPHVFLNEIMRQAQESEIIRLTMDIREGKPIAPYHGKEVQVFNRNELSTGMMTWADQILVATNATRHNINNQMRTFLGYSGPPNNGERLICLKNYWDDTNLDGEVLVNGTTGYIQNPFESFRDVPYYLKASSHRLPCIVGNFVPDCGIGSFDGIEIDKQMLLTGEKCVDWKTAYNLGKMKPKIGDIVPKEFAYAYAITCHKAQGSEWDKVLVLEEGFPYKKEEHARWLYTACTRASEKLVLIKE